MLLHDTTEDTNATAEELRKRFGEVITNIVVDVTDDKGLLKGTRKLLQIEYAPSLSREAKLVKSADKICNIRDVTATPPADWPLERRRGYFDWAKQVVDGLRGVHRKLEGVFDSAYGERQDHRLIV